MPKLFPIHIEVEELAVGKVMRLLNKMPGIAKLNLDLEREVKSNGHREPKTPRGRFAKSGEQTIIEALYDKSPMTTSEVRQVFIDQGRSGASISSCLHELKTNGSVKSDHDGYSLTKKARDRQRFHAKNARKKR